MITIEQLLEQWEKAYKKGLLSFWILLLLHDKWLYAYEMSTVIAEISNNTILVDEKSIYRALKRFEENKIVRSEKRVSAIGPARRYYTLTAVGKTLLKQFIQRNILIFEKPEVAAMIEQALDSN